jgi:hypothetical protein
MCGADDCRRCNPGNFIRVGKRQRFISEDISDEEFEEAQESEKQAEFDRKWLDSEV